MTERRVPWDMPAYLERVRRACFVCEMLAGTPGYEHDVIHRDDVGVAFLPLYPVARGHVLVAPIEHREHVIAGLDADDYLALQALVHRAGRAVTQVLAPERLYVLSLGSQQANRHVHWHLVPLPPGVPYESQQLAWLDESRGRLVLDDDDRAALLAALRAALPGPGPSPGG
jgi:diadenosine tetraphosphate (Ap4A) HIT family hydrolase